MAYDSETTYTQRSSHEEDAAQEEATVTRSAETTEREQVLQALAEAQAKAEANLAGWQRAVADLANFRRRSDQERSELVKSANADLIRRLLPVLDDFARGLQAIPADEDKQPWVEGMRLIERKLLSIFDQEGVTPFDALGQDFDPALHDAVTFEASEPDTEGKVIGEVQKGYRLRDRVLRPAMVRVGKGRTK